MKLHITNTGSTFGIDRPTPAPQDQAGDGEKDIFGLPLTEPNSFNGTPTKIVDADTGQPVQGLLVQRIALAVDVSDLLWKGEISVVDPKLDLVVDVKIVESQPTIHYLLERAMVEQQANLKAFEAAEIEGPGPDGFPIDMPSYAFNDLVKYLCSRIGPVRMIGEESGGPA